MKTKTEQLLEDFNRLEPIDFPKESIPFTTVIVTDDNNKETRVYYRFISLDYLALDIIDRFASAIQSKTISLNKANSLFEDKFGIHSGQIMIYGDSSEISSQNLKGLIPYTPKRQLVTPNRDIPDKYEIIKSYHCFEGYKDSILSNTIIHEDITSSWQCFLRKNDIKDLFLIYKV